jgi:hypothetical protein
MTYTQHRDTQDVLTTLDKLDIDNDNVVDDEEVSFAPLKCAYQSALSTIWLGGRLLQWQFVEMAIIKTENLGAL